MSGKNGALTSSPATLESESLDEVRVLRAQLDKLLQRMFLQDQAQHELSEGLDTVARELRLLTAGQKRLLSAPPPVPPVDPRPDSILKQLTTLEKSLHAVSEQLYSSNKRHDSRAQVELRRLSQENGRLRTELQEIAGSRKWRLAMWIGRKLDRGRRWIGAKNG